jgi:hypothetical protein
MSLTDVHGKPQDTKKPSWVPDYGAKPARRIGIIDGEWHAGGYVPVRWCCPEVHESGLLICGGMVVDVIDGTGAISRADLEAGALKLESGDNIGKLRQPKSTWNSKTAGEDTIYDVLVGGCDRNGRKAPVSFKCLYTAFPVAEPQKQSPFYRNWHFINSSADLMIDGRTLASYFSHLTDTSGPDSTLTPPSASKSGTNHDMRPSDAMKTAAARQTMEARTKMRRLIITQSGLLGIAPVQTQPGDVVIVLPGHGKPLIARKPDNADEEDDLWYLIGEAYIRGMMEAEKMALSAEPWHEREKYKTAEKLRNFVFV